MLVFVLDKNGHPLMPTHNGAKVRVLLKQKRAKVISKYPFTVKLVYKSTSFTQPLTLGVDTGSKYVGSAVINDTTSEVVYESQTELRDDIKSKMDRRRQFRRTRRNKLRYRPSRFNNRKASKRKNRYAPTLISKFQGHTREIEFIKFLKYTLRDDLLSSNNCNVYVYSEHLVLSLYTSKLFLNIV